MIKAGTDAITIVLEDGERVYPCRCGETHRGEYAIYDYGHHNCLHETRLLGLLAGKDRVQAICPDCGMSWLVDIEKE